MSLKVTDLSFSYITRPVLKGVSFEAKEGQLLAVMGPNGVGKTTLFRCILGLNKRYSGNIEVDGVSIRNLSAKEQAHHITYIPQIHAQTFSYSVQDMVMMGAAHRISELAVPGESEQKKAQNILDRLGIGHLAKRDFGHLSGGEQQLVLVARALIQDARTILMDEPTASLDYGNQTMVLQQARALANDGYTVLLSTHNPQHALWFADKALALYDGSVAAFGKPPEVLNEELIYRLYKVKADFIKTENGLMISPQIDKGDNA